MPRLRGRSDHVKLYRPRDAPYANGTVNLVGFHGASAALQRAIAAFAEEFSRAPRMDRCVAEIVFATNNTSATIYEITDTSDD